MRIELIHRANETGAFCAPENANNTNVDTALYFADFDSLSDRPPYEKLKSHYSAQLMCSTPEHPVDAAANTAKWVPDSNKSTKLALLHNETVTITTISKEVA